MDTLFESLWDVLTPSIGTVALGIVAIALMIGMRKAVDKLGTAPVLLTIGGIVIIAWAVRYVTAPSRIEVREVKKPVERAVVDTTAADALRADLESERKKVAAERSEKQGLLQSLFGAKSEASATKEEIARLNSIEIQKKAVFDRWYAEAKKRPFYEVAQKDDRHFSLTRYEIVSERFTSDSPGERNEHYLVRSIYDGDIAADAQPQKGVLQNVTISVREPGMSRFGKSSTFGVYMSVPLTVEHHKLNTQELTENLEDGVFRLSEHRSQVAKHMSRLKEWIDRRRSPH